MAIAAKKKVDKPAEKPARLTAATAAATPIGTPIGPAMNTNASMPMGRMVSPPPSMAMPEPAEPPPPATEPPKNLMAIGPQINPTAKAASDSANSRLGSLITQGPPQYHGLKRVGDALLGATNIGTAIGQAAHLGTPGYDADVSRAGEAAKLENTQQAAADTSAKSQADTVKAQADTAESMSHAGQMDTASQIAQQGADDVMITLGDGRSVTIPAKDKAGVLKTLMTNQNQKDVAGINNTARAGLQSTQHLSLDQLASKAIQENDQDTLQQVQHFKESLAKAGATEPGSYLPVNDAAGNVVGWVNPKAAPEKQFVPVGAIAGVGQAAGGQTSSGAPAIPPKPTGQALSREEQANVVMRAGTNLINDISSHKAKLGNMKGLLESAILNTPWSDPETQGLRASIASFAALQPAMHGFRGTDALREFEKLLGGIPNNPDSLIAAIQAMMKTAGAFNPTPTAPASAPASTIPSGVLQYDAQGKRVQ